MSQRKGLQRNFKNTAKEKKIEIKHKNSFVSSSSPFPRLWSFSSFRRHRHRRHRRRRHHYYLRRRVSHAETIIQNNPNDKKV